MQLLDHEDSFVGYLACKCLAMYVKSGVIKVSLFILCAFSIVATSRGRADNMNIKLLDSFSGKNKCKEFQSIRFSSSLKVLKSKPVNLYFQDPLAHIENILDRCLEVERSNSRGTLYRLEILSQIYSKKTKSHDHDDTEEKLGEYHSRNRLNIY